MVGCVVGLEGHAVVTHPAGTVSTEFGVSTARDLAILCPPVLVDGIFLHDFHGRGIVVDAEDGAGTIAGVEAGSWEVLAEGRC